MIAITSRDVVNLGKFVVVFVVAFMLHQLFKNPVEAVLINSEMINRVPQMIEIVFLALPNLFFYTCVGMALSVMIHERILFWLMAFCVLELGWQVYFLHPRILAFGGVVGYLLIYSRLIVLPFAVMFGGWIYKKIGPYLLLEKLSEEHDDA